MPSKKSSSTGSSAQVPVWMEQETQNNILSKLKALEEQQRSCNCYGSTNSALCSALVKFKADAKTVDEKACRIAWIGIEEHADDSTTTTFDKEALKEVIETSGDDELLAEWQTRRIGVHRHPPVRNNSQSLRPRIIKITSLSQDLRDRLLAYMRRGRLSLTKHCVHSYAPKDYTKEELEYDRSLRKKAGLLNQQRANSYTFFVIYAYKN
ncbi:hypothetical protein ANCDUO_10212 [Ancylostoma duodenale]|uniref:Uncharacterized protein n=1 Tax=Ancylostoma duodenale TaxID=51022 RepID=A0A0C2GKX5_9BILA|nr:hypothetical protein ANCDUO_10212 [Ancylostoma duodenale]